MTQLSVKRLNPVEQAGAGPWEGAEPEARTRRRSLGGSSGQREGTPPRCPLPPALRKPELGTHSNPLPTLMLHLLPTPPRTPVLPEVPPPSTLSCLSCPLCMQLQWDAPGRADWGHRGLRGAWGLPGQPWEAQEALLSSARTILHGREVLPGPSRGGDLPEQGREDQR